MLDLIRTCSCDFSDFSLSLSSLSEACTPSAMYLGALLILLARYLWVRSALKEADPAHATGGPWMHNVTIENMEEMLAKRDANAGSNAVRPGCGSRITWAGGPASQTDLAVVYLHGWSASPEEMAPFDARVAQALGANLLALRLTAHGLTPDRAGAAMVAQPTRTALQDDCALGYALGKLLGKRVVLVGSSTGATLSVWLSTQPWVGPELAALVLISPIFAIKKLGRTLYLMLRWVFLLLPRFLAVQLIHALAGKLNRVNTKYHKCMVRKANHERVWTTQYPTRAALHLIELYVGVEVSADMRRLRAPTLVLACPRDGTSDFQATLKNMTKWQDATLEEVHTSENPHVLCGDIASPCSTDLCVDAATSFLKRKLGSKALPGAASPPAVASPAAVVGGRSASPAAASAGPRRRSSVSPSRSAADKEGRAGGKAGSPHEDKAGRRPSRSPLRSASVTSHWPR